MEEEEEEVGEYMMSQKKGRTWNKEARKYANNQPDKKKQEEKIE